MPVPTLSPGNGDTARRNARPARIDPADSITARREGLASPLVQSRPMLKLENCRERQTRLLGLMERQQLDLAILSNPKTIYYFSGLLVAPQEPHAFLLTSSGKSVLITHAAIGTSLEVPDSAADETEIYDWCSIEKDATPTSWDQDVTALVRGAAERISPGSGRLRGKLFSFGKKPAGGAIGIEFESASHSVAAALSEWSGKPPANLTPEIDQMRRQKDPDEIECIRHAVTLAEAGLAAVKEKLEAGMREHKAYAIYHEAVVAKAETSVLVNGDFASGPRAAAEGGPPSDRRVQLGDLFIFDTSPVYHGYLCDLTRTFVVGRPSQLQLDAWSHVMEAHGMARKAIRPGIPAKEIYHAMKEHLDKFEPAAGSFRHHAGHGIGMSGWELPWLTPGSEHIIQDREVLACEPALYADGMQGGVRLEHDYLVTPEGAVAFDHFPMGLT